MMSLMCVQKYVCYFKVTMLTLSNVSSVESSSTCKLGINYAPKNVASLPIGTLFMMNV